jgi:hypothetical protein
MRRRDAYWSDEKEAQIPFLEAAGKRIHAENDMIYPEARLQAAARR